MEIKENIFASLFSKVDYEKNPIEAIATNHPLKDKIVFGGLFNKVKVGMYIKKVIYSDPVTVVFWSDNTKTTCKAQHGDTYSKETGLALCVLKKLVGGEQVAKLMEDWIRTENVIDLKLIRATRKESKNSAPVITEEVIEEVANVQKSKSRKKVK